MDETTTGPLDEEVCRSIHDRLTGDDRFETVTFEPTSDRIRTVVATYDRSLFPDDVQSAQLDVRWYVGGDFSIHYSERWADGSPWECRWDRHPKAVGRAHFHPPPDAGSAAATDFPRDYRDVWSIVTAYVSERIETLWAET
ncbi:hypothetical protein [Saliphagus infecundisoli]|uniref:Histidine kinase n=1 Tax=Saliphagus infecundisoli TaxID=1849069 RepID=A0ABD5QGN8_9EURY|nr:hypothetical protein [Saliphagus infecundisoli]